MKLKDRPLEWWRGKKYTYWCKADRNDERKINYTVHHRSIGKGLREFKFASTDKVNWEMLWFLKEGRINSIKLKNNEWFVVIDAGVIPAKLYKS